MESQTAGRRLKPHDSHAEAPDKKSQKMEENVPVGSSGDDDIDIGNVEVPGMFRRMLTEMSCVREEVRDASLGVVNRPFK